MSVHAEWISIDQRFYDRFFFFANKTIQDIESKAWMWMAEDEGRSWKQRIEEENKARKDDQ